MEAESHHKTLHCLIYERQQAAGDGFLLPFSLQNGRQREHTAKSWTVTVMRDAACPIHPAGPGVPPAVMNLLELLELWTHSYFVKIESAMQITET